MSRTAQEVIARAKAYKRLYDRGEPIARIAEQFAIDRTSVRNGLEKLGVKLEKRIHKPTPYIRTHQVPKPYIRTHQAPKPKPIVQVRLIRDGRGNVIGRDENPAESARLWREKIIEEEKAKQMARDIR